MYAGDAAVYLGINRQGLGIVRLKDDGPTVSVVPDARFAARTLRNVFRHNDRIHCHLYRDTVVSSDTRQPASGAALVAYDPETGGYTDVVLPFQEEHPDWEATGLVRTTPNVWLLTWKQTTARGVRYRRQRYDPTTGGTEDVGLEAYQRAYRFQSIRRAPKPLARLVRRVSAPASSVVHVTVDGQHMSVPLRYRDGAAKALASGSAELVHIPVWRHDSSWYLLAHRQILVAHESGDLLPPIDLPSLPAEAEYTGIAVASGFAVVAWGERAFPMLGASGFVILDLSS
jgi:hypothetical protein